MVVDVRMRMSHIKSMNKTRHNLFFDSAQWRELLKLAKKTGLSAAEHIRRALDQYLEKFK